MAQSTTQLLKGRWVIWGLSLFFAVLAGIGVLLIVGKAADRVPVYVANQALPARTQITPENVMQMDVNADAVFPTALTYEEIISGEMFTTVALSTGDVLTTAVTGGLTPINYQLPAGYVTASLAVPPENAVGGKVKAGDYVDVAAVGTGTRSSRFAKVVMQNVLVLDVTVSPASIADTAVDAEDPNAPQPGPESAQVRGGIPEMYVLAVTPEDFAVMTLISGSEISLALSQSDPPRQLQAWADETTVFNEKPVSNSGAGTEEVFEPAPSASPTAAPAPSDTAAPVPSGVPTGDPFATTPSPTAPPSLEPTLAP